MPKELAGFLAAIFVIILASISFKRITKIEDFKKLRDCGQSMRLNIDLLSFAFLEKMMTSKKKPMRNLQLLEFCMRYWGRPLRYYLALLSITIVGNSDHGANADGKIKRPHWSALRLPLNVQMAA